MKDCREVLTWKDRLFHEEHSQLDPKMDLLPYLSVHLWHDAYLVMNLDHFTDIFSILVLLFRIYF